MNMQTTESSLDQAAADWILKLEDKNPADQAAFMAWLQRDPRHVAAYMDAYHMYRLMDGLDPGKQIDVEPLTRSRLSNVIHFRFMRDRAPRPTAKAAGQTRSPPWAAAAAILLLMGAGWLTLGQLWNPAVFETRVGEQREIKLDDGSIIHLNTRSRVKVDYTDGARQVELREGEALFTVARDATRPFRVLAGNTVIQAVGTQFNVYKRSYDTQVTVTEGAVDIAPSQSSPASRQRLKTGEEAHVTPAGAIQKTETPQIDRSVAWQKRELIFHDTALPDVIAEFNRYNRTQFTLEGAAAQTLRISGNFGADYPQSLLLYLERIPSIGVSVTDERVVIRGR